MKNRMIFWGLVLILGWTSAGPALAAREARKAELSTATGTIEWLQSGETDWKSASLNQKLESGDKVRTGENSEAVLTLDDGSTIQLFAQTEFAVQSLAKDKASQQLETVVAILRGRLRADVRPQPQGSIFEFETPVMVASIRGTITGIVINEDGSVGVLDEDGAIQLLNEAGINFTADLDAADNVQVTYNKETNQITIHSINGTFNVIGPDGTVYTLNTGDSVILGEGAATFVPAGTPGGDAPTGDAIGEPIVTGAAEGEAESESESEGEGTGVGTGVGIGFSPSGG